MIEEIAENLYRVEIPLPGNPLKALNSYVIKSQSRNLIIDTGFNRKECKETMLAALGKLNIDLHETDFFITHLHADHYGQVSELSTNDSKIYFNKSEASWFESGTGRKDDAFAFAGRHGFPQDQLKAALQNHPGYKYKSDWHHLIFHSLSEGDAIDIGDYHLNIVETPGHSEGHQCLYDPGKKIFFSGDHILIDITPNLQQWSDKGNALGNYLLSLDKVYAFDIELVLPGHRRTFLDSKKRIDELKQHHKRRCDEILLILKKGEQSAFQVAAQMSWDIKYDSWDQFPVSQKWFATGEAIAHLKYLEINNLIKKRTLDENFLYSLA